MSVFKQKNSIAKTELSSFSGINASPPKKGGTAAMDMINFKVLPDGSLKKRCGFAPLASFEHKVRAVWSGYLDSKDTTFIVHGSDVDLIDGESGTLTKVGTLKSVDSHVIFIFFEGKLFLMDGDNIYHVSRESASTFEGYAPLYADGWPSAKVGEVNEELNLTTRHIRMRYRVTESLIYLRVVHKLSSIDAVYLNGTLLDSSKYYYDEDLMCLCVLNIRGGDVVEAYLTIKEDELKNADFLSCSQSVVYGGYRSSRIFFWGGQSNDIMYGSVQVDDALLEESKKVYGDTVALYIPQSAAFSIGRDARRITGACRQYGRLLIFTDTDTWMVESPSDGAEALDAVMINSSFGCSSQGAALMCENDPVCISSGTVLRWSADTDELGETNAYSISRAVDPYLAASKSFFKNAKILLDKNSSELYFFDPEEKDSGVIWVYNYKSSCWYKYGGIEAEFMFMFGDKVGFIDGSSVYLFDESLSHDVLADNTQKSIEATFESHPTDLSLTGRTKRLCGVSFTGELLGEEMNIELTSDEEPICSAKIFNESETEGPCGVIKRLSSKRFDHISAKISTVSGKAQRICSVSIFAKK